MIVCICEQVSSTALNLAIEEAPIYPVSPYSRDYVPPEDQIFDYVQKTLKVSTNCRNCELFVRQCIKDKIYSSNR